MKTLKTLTAMILGLAICALANSQTPSSSSGADSKKVDALVKQLGSSRYVEREQAQKELEGMGAAALDALRKAAKEGDAEIAKRAADMVRRLEDKINTDTLLAPKKVKLSFKDTPVADAVAELAKQSGYIVKLENPAAVAKRKVTLETGEVSFFEALDKLCAAANLVEKSQSGPMVGPNPGVRPGVRIGPNVPVPLPRPGNVPPQAVPGVRPNLPAPLPTPAPAPANPPKQSSVTEQTTGRLMFGVGINSDAAVMGAPFKEKSENASLPPSLSDGISDSLFVQVPGPGGQQDIDEAMQAIQALMQVQMAQLAQMQAQMARLQAQIQAQQLPGVPQIQVPPLPAFPQIQPFPGAGGIGGGFGGIGGNFGPGGFPAQQQPRQFILADGKPPQYPTSYFGAVRIRLLPAAPGMKAEAGEVLFTMDVTAEPRLQGFQVTSNPSIVKALDNEGQLLTAIEKQVNNPNPGQPNPPFAFPNPFNQIGSFNQRTFPIRLKLGEKKPKSLKELEGTMTVSVQLPASPVATIKNVLKAAGESGKHKDSGNVVMTLKSIDKAGDKGYKVQIVLENNNKVGNPFGGGAGGVQIIGGGQVQIQVFGGPMMGMGQDLPSLVDAKGKAYKPGPITNSGIQVNNGVIKRTITLEYRADADQGEPAELVMSEARSTTLAVPFSFKNVPLNP